MVSDRARRLRDRTWSAGGAPRCEGRFMTPRPTSRSSRQITHTSPERPRTPSALASPVEPADTRELFKRWQRDRDLRARDELFERHLPLVRKLARRYVGAREPFEDLVQVGSFGLLKALDRFDPERGTAFSSFAVPTITGELKRYFRDTGWAVHVPRGAQELALKIQEAQEVLTTRTGRSPTLPDLAQYTELSMMEVLEGLEVVEAHHATSLQAPQGEGDADAATLEDRLGFDDPGFALTEESATVEVAMQSLSPFERQVLYLRFFGGLTQSEIGRKTGVSQMQISRVLRRSLKTLAELAETSGGREDARS